MYYALGKRSETTGHSGTRAIRVIPPAVTLILVRHALRSFIRAR